MGVPVHGRVRRRRNVCWFGVVHRKKEFTIWETYTGILGDNILFERWIERRVYIRETYKGILGYNYLFKIERRVYIRETYKGILGYNYLFKMSVYEITQDTGSQRVEWYMKMLLDSKKLGTYVKKIPQQMGNKIESSGDSDCGIYTSHWVVSGHKHYTLNKHTETHMKGVLNLLDRKVLLSRLHSTIVHNIVLRHKSLRGMALYFFRCKNLGVPLICNYIVR